MITSKSCVRRVLQQDNFPANIYIDNDHGLLLSVEKFIQQGMPLDNDDMSKGVHELTDSMQKKQGY